MKRPCFCSLARCVSPDGCVTIKSGSLRRGLVNFCPFRRCFRRDGFSFSWAAAATASGGSGFPPSSSYFWTAAVPAPAGRRTLGFPATSPRSPWFTPCVFAYSCGFAFDIVCLRIRRLRIRRWMLWDSPDSFPFCSRFFPFCLHGRSTGGCVGPGFQPDVDLFG